MEPHLQPNTHEKFSSYAVTYTVITEQQSPQGDPGMTRHEGGDLLRVGGGLE